MEYPFLSEEHRMIVEVVRRFVREDLMPLEKSVLEREATGLGLTMRPEDEEAINRKSKALGLWGLDVPASSGGSELPATTMIAIHTELWKTIVPYKTLPDAPNLMMMLQACTPYQLQKYAEPLGRGERLSFIAISEPGAGGDPAAMNTTATRDGDHYVLNGRKIWISRVFAADFGLVLASTNKEAGRSGISAFIVDTNTPSFQIARKIPMIAGQFTAELVFDNCRIPAANLLGQEGQGFALMQHRLSLRRLEIGAWCLGFAHRALNMMIDHVTQRKTFGILLAERQAIQWWIADATTRMHAFELMLFDAARRIQDGERLRSELSMIKVYATEMAWDIVDQAMQ